jgi:hypothetical protein
MMLRVFYDYVFDFDWIFYFLLLEDLLMFEINLMILNEVIVEEDHFDDLLMFEINNLLLVVEKNMLEKKIMILLENYYYYYYYY